MELFLWMIISVIFFILSLSTIRISKHKIKNLKLPGKRKECGSIILYTVDPDDLHSQWVGQKPTESDKDIIENPINEFINFLNSQTKIQNTIAAIGFIIAGYTALFSMILIII